MYMYLEIIYLIYMYKKYLALNNLRWLICHKTKPNLRTWIAGICAAIWKCVCGCQVILISTLPLPIKCNPLFITGLQHFTFSVMRSMGTMFPGL